MCLFDNGSECAYHFTLPKWLCNAHLTLSCYYYSHYLLRGLYLAWGNHKPLSPNRKISPQCITVLLYPLWGLSYPLCLAAVVMNLQRENTPESCRLRNLSCAAVLVVELKPEETFQSTTKRPSVLWLVWNQFPLHILFPWGDPWPHKNRNLGCGVHGPRDPFSLIHQNCNFATSYDILGAITSH